MDTGKTDKQIAVEAIEEAKAILKGKGLRIWRELGITRGAVWQWKLEGRYVPAKHCQKISALTDGRVSCQRLNPDVFGSSGAEEKHT